MQTRSSIMRFGISLFCAFLLPLVAALTARGQSAGKATVDVNSADLKTLETLPGITPTLAGRIVDGRPYKDIGDLAKVKGLTKSKLNAIQDHITFGPKTAANKKTSAKSANKVKETDTGEASTSTTKQTSSTTRQQPATPSPTGSSSGRLAPGQTININTASAEELDALPGIGPTKAQAIVDYRSQNGRFNSIEDIQKVKGIKEGEFSKIKDYIRVR